MGGIYPDPNITTPVKLIGYANTVTGGYFTIIFMVASSIILFILFRARLYKTSVSVAAASFLTLILSSFIWAMGYLNGRYLLVYLIITLGCTIWSIFEK